MVMRRNVRLFCAMLFPQPLTRQESGKPADLQVNMKRHHCCVDNMPRGFVVAESMATML